MSPPGYPSAWLRPRRASFRFTRQSHLTSHRLLAAKFSLLPRRFQLPVPRLVDFFLPSCQHVGRRNVTDGAVQSHRVVVFDIVANQPLRLLLRQRRTGYAMRELCERMLDGETGGLLELLPRNGTYGPDEISSMLVMAATAVFLLHLTHAQPKVDLSRDKHPPIVLRQHRILDVLHSWLAARGKSIADMTGARRHAIMQAVGSALPDSLWTLWNAQVDLLESATGLQYLEELAKLAGTK